MKIFIDPEIFMLQKYGGISRYFCNLMQFLNECENVDARAFLSIHVNSYMSGNFDHGICIQDYPFKSAKYVQFFARAYSECCARLFKPNIIHETYYRNIYTEFPKSKRVITIYDMIFEKFPDMFLGSSVSINRKKEAISQADHIICISASTKADLTEFFDIPKSKISVTYLAASDYFEKARKIGEFAYLVDFPFLLYVGKRGGYKNFQKFLLSYNNSKYIKNNFGIVCFGDSKFTIEEKELIKQLNIHDSRILHFSGNDVILSDLYRQAIALVYPSIYEGFGVPLLEAMASGCPVICSNTSSIPEVVESAGEYFNPYEIESISKAIESVVSSDRRRAELINLGDFQFKKFSWNKCANETLSIYNSIL